MGSGFLPYQPWVLFYICSLTFEKQKNWGTNHCYSGVEGEKETSTIKSFN